MLLGKCRADPRHDDQRRRIADLAQTADQNWAACRRRAPFAAALRAAQIALAGQQEEAPSSAHTVLDVLVGERQLFTSTRQPVTSAQGQMDK
jgi:hypothetical protein